MTKPEVSGAVDYFSRNSRAFHENYGSAEEFKERLEVWDDILPRVVTPGGLALDMGCGSGVFTFRLAALGSRVIGVDGSPDMVEFCESQRQARNLEGVRFVQGLLPNVDEAALGPVDLIVSSSVVEYVPDLDKTLGLFARLLKPGAPLVISMPNASGIGRVHQRLKFRLTGKPEVYAHIRHFSSPRALAARALQHQLILQESHLYAHQTRLSRLIQRMGLPLGLTADLFVCVFRKGLA